MNLLEKVKSDYLEYHVTKELPLWEVNLLGYLASDCYVPIGEPAKFHLVELLNEGGTKQANFSYLLHIGTGVGFLMPRSFSEYASYLP